MNGLIQISKYAGMRNDLAQAGGGNTSVKIDDQVMLVKSSGYQLADVNRDSGCMKVDYWRFVAYFEKNITGGTENISREETAKEQV